MFAFSSTSIAFIKNRVTNGENKVDDAADDLEILSKNAEVKKKKIKSENLKNRDGICNLRITFLRKKTWQLEWDQ